jgi:hypothetical protein
VAAASSPPADPLAAATDRVRETVKWLITAFAAIGAVLVAGSQLSTLSRLNPSDWRLWIAVLGLAIGLGGVGFAIWKAVDVITPQQITLGDLAWGQIAKGEHSNDQIEDVRNREDLNEIAGFINGIPEIFEGLASDVVDLKTSYLRLLSERQTAVEASYAPPHGEESQAAAKIANARVVATGAVVRNVLAVANWEQVRTRFRRARAPIFVGGGLTAFGVFLFAWAAGGK